MKPIRWRAVTGGIAALAAITAGVTFVLVYARAGSLHGSVFRLYVATTDGSNLLRGSDVWLNGQRVGTVQRIAFNDATSAPDVRVIIEIEVLNAVREHIRLDSRATLKSGGTIIGAPVVFIQGGTLAMRGVVPDDTLRGPGTSDREIAAVKITATMEQLPALLADGRQIMAQSKAAGGRLGTILSGNSPMRSARALMTQARAGRGTASRILNDTAIHARVAHSMATVDSLRAFLATRADEMGRFRRDSSLAPLVRDLRLHVAALQAQAASTAGTIGRARADSALRVGLGDAVRQLDSLMADIKKHPLRYARVFQDT